MAKITTETGFTCEIDPAVADDMELLDLLVELDSGNAIVIPQITNKLLNADDKRALYDKIRTNGRVPIAAFAAELKAIFDSLGKNEKK